MKLYKASMEMLDNVDFSPHFDRDGNFVIPVKGFIFSRNQKDTDLEGDHFHTGTDRGPLEKVLSYFDHQMSDYYIPREVNGVAIRGFGGKRIGHAEKQLTDEEKEIWNIIVDRRHEYMNLIEELAMEKMLGASSLALYREDDPNVKGRINIWDTAAMDLTPTPAEPKAEAIVKHFLIENFQEIDLEIIDKGKDMPTLEENIKNAFKNADVEEEALEEEASQEEVPEEETQQTETVAEDVDNPTEEDILGAEGVNDLKALLLGMNDRFDRMEKEQQRSIGMVKDMQDAFPVFAEETAKYVAKSIREVGRQTIEEFEAESEAIKRQSRKKSSPRTKGESLYKNKMNPNAPGVR